MRFRLWCTVGLGLAIFLAGCGGKGVDKKLVTDSEADAYIARHTSRIASTTAELAQNAERLANDELQIKIATEELAKITFEPIGLKRDDFFRRSELEYTVHNGSKYDISSLGFDAWLFVDDEERSGRKCRFSGYYQYHNGLPQGKTLKNMSTSSGFDCRTWDTLEVKNAKKLFFRIDLDPQSVKDFAEKTIMPTLSIPTRSSYEQSIKRSEEAIAKAMAAKASLVME
ncbi:hypothetical protein H0484_02785 [Pusillimonas sp. CC-YST705]|uniref:Lipoprotein n=1 Tax=Mesopusillimonas faecipullorum TaxID=2755040 RepID=A0ABS8C9H5_9BURK|nr:hypothetical protein [Mesopusillimonas faecipullorum]MCB5362681.1 hypothetical protein [Mesopusillimonas faecipullorum]